MKVTVQHVFVRSTDAVDSLVEDRILELSRGIEIEEARVRLEHQRESSPAFRARVHLVTPGPDVHAEARDHTLAAAIEKVMAELERRIHGRSARRMRRVKSNLQEPFTSREPQPRLG